MKYIKLSNTNLSSVNVFKGGDMKIKRILPTDLRGRECVSFRKVFRQKKKIRHYQTFKANQYTYTIIGQNNLVLEGDKLKI